ncbi:uncharacterized protein LOC122385050 [Amphibalanus amphitrite]|uniref:uncharacterized protein LOC122373491 n=1 Tax=Amphibalanus amphitrite TaxID=1232801 RepID=UPI001C9240F2|nr:uncharacterized protein LOC122373491 [Amphibalanus amphitrite]XP_043228962.1 uncharacterized protein LOC122385050 [Amphibalanus amphitrite]
MKMVVFFACLAAASASTLLRAPSHDSATIQSHRFGGNFAYRSDEAHAYAAINPVVSNVRRAVGVSYSQGAPIVRSVSVEGPAPIAYSAAAPITYSGLGYAGYHL